MITFTVGRISWICSCRCTISSAFRKQLIHASAVRSKMVPFKSVPVNELGESILLLRENGFSESPTDTMKRIIVIAKVMSWASSTVGLVLIPLLTSKLMESAAENPGTVILIVFANSFLSLFTFSPLLLHFLTKRFVANVYFNSKSQKQALRYKSEDVVDVAVALAKKKMIFPLATCFVESHPLLLLLDRRMYSNQEAFDLLTKNVIIPKGHD